MGSITAQVAAQVEVEVLGSALGAHPGSEIIGIVRSAGDSAQHLLGQPVLIPRLLPCGECELCRRGRIANCSALARRPTRPGPSERLPARFLIPLQPPYLTAPPPPQALFRYAALCDALLAPYAGLVRAGIGPGTLCVVLGGGARAAFAVVAARAIGAQVAVLCAEADERQRLCAPPYAALAAFDPSQLDAAAAKAALQKLCKDTGLPAHGLCLLEVSGSDAGRARALDLLEAGGTAVLLDRQQPLGAPPVAEPPLPVELAAGPSLHTGALLSEIVAQGCTIVGAGPPHPDLLPELLALIERARVDLDSLTRAVSPAEIDAVMTARRRGQGGVLERLTLPIVCYPPVAAASAGQGPP